MPFNFQSSKIPEVVLIKPKIFGDSRGYFAEVFKSSKFRKFGINLPFKQVNFSHSPKGVLRGLHFQLKPHEQGKLVQVVNGEIFDVAVDIRRGSPTFGQWVGECLKGEDKSMLYVPEGFAHGFCVISDYADVIYYCSNEYDPESERGLKWDDPALGIKWPVGQPEINTRDNQFPPLEKIENNFEYQPQTMAGKRDLE